MGAKATLQELYNNAMLASTGGVAGSALGIGQLAAAASWTTGTTITMAANLPAWVVNGMNVYDVTNAKQVGTVSSTSGTTLTLTGAATNASQGSADVLQFGFTPTDVNNAFNAGRDARGAVEIAILKCQEAIQALTDLNTDVTLLAANSTLVSSAITSLS